MKILSHELCLEAHSIKNIGSLGHPSEKKLNAFVIVLRRY